MLQVLSGYSYHLSKGEEEAEQHKAALFVSMMKNSVLDPASGALGKPISGAWSEPGVEVPPPRAPLPYSTTLSVPQSARF